jgi:hypothetical protein
MIFSIEKEMVYGQRTHFFAYFSPVTKFRLSKGNISERKMVTIDLFSYLEERFNFHVYNA